MKNGVNIGATSELMHEICRDPAEALVRFRSSAEPLAELARVRMATIRMGSLRVARDFCLEADRGTRPDGALPLPAHYLLTALGGCVMFSWVAGCTLRGITLGKLGIRVRAAVEGAGPNGEAPPFGAVGYDVNIESDASSQQVVEIAKAVTCFSPMHRTFVEGSEPAVEVADAAQARTPSPLSRPPRTFPSASSGAGREERSALEVALQWGYGAHFTVQFEPDGPRWASELDQPKQFGGLDRAPNPQEYATAGLAADALFALGGAPAVKAVSVSGEINLHGFLNTGLTHVVRLHDVLYRVEGGLPLPRIERALRACPTYQTLITPTPIRVTATAKGERLLDFKSDLDSVRQTLAAFPVSRNEAL